MKKITQIRNVIPKNRNGEETKKISQQKEELKWELVMKSRKKGKKKKTDKIVSETKTKLQNT